MNYHIISCLEKEVNELDRLRRTIGNITWENNGELSFYSLPSMAGGSGSVRKYLDTQIIFESV